jgi:hypothetical protein
MTALSNCPFCGGQVAWCCPGQDVDSCDDIHCARCQAYFTFGLVDEDYDSDVDEIRASIAHRWNRRLARAK